MKSEIKNESQIKSWRSPAFWIAGCFAFAVFITLWWNSNRNEPPKNQGKQEQAAEQTPTADEIRAVHSSEAPMEKVPPLSTRGNLPKPEVPAHQAANKDETPQKTRASRKDQIITSSGKRKSIIDPMASWNETPPWPEGPRLLADVETPAMRYVNLRPNEMGVMPSLNVKPSEVLDISLSVPESAPGEPIYLELPNGGGFPGETARGKSLPVTENRTVSFSINAAALRGHCTVHIRQGGHTRTLPLWVGDLPAPAGADPVDPNSPAI